MISLFTDAGPDWVSVWIETLLLLITILGGVFGFVQRRKAAAAESEADKYAKIIAEAQQRIAELEEEKTRRDELERLAKPWEVSHYHGDTYEFTNLTGDTAYSVRGIFYGRSMEHFPQGIDMNYRASKTFLWATNYDEESCTEITLIWKESPEGEDFEFILNMPAKK